MPRKRKRERKEAMALRLADDSGRTLEECTRMTPVEIDAELKDLGLTGQMKVQLSTEEHNEGKSWEEVNAAKAASEGEKVAVTPSRKRRKNEPKASMAQRLAAGSLWTLAECMRMTLEEIDAKLKDLDLTGRLSGYNEGQSWEERAAAKAKKAAEKAAKLVAKAKKAAEKADKVLKFDAEGQIVLSRNLSSAEQRPGPNTKRPKTRQ